MYIPVEPGKHAIQAAKRLGVTSCDHMGDDWYTSWSPRNSSECAEGEWCQWVHLARLILADEKTRAEMPDHFRPYDGPSLYTEHHPECRHNATKTGDESC